MKKAFLMTVMALVVLWLITPVMSTATTTSVSGSFTGSPTAEGKKGWVTKDGILHFKDAAAAGPNTGDLLGLMQFTLSGAIDLNTGLGSGHGDWVFSDDHGTFEGAWRVDFTGVIYFEGSAVGLGTGDYEGMLFRVDSFWGYNLYLGGLPPEVPNGIHFDSVGTLLSSKGLPLP